MTRCSNIITVPGGWGVRCRRRADGPDGLCQVCVHTRKREDAVRRAAMRRANATIRQRALASDESRMLIAVAKRLRSRDPKRFEALRQEVL